MVSSAIYRYFSSRDDLLTALIIDAYNSLGEATEKAEATVDRTNLRGSVRGCVPRDPGLGVGQPA